MPRRPRLLIDHAIYYVVQASGAGQTLFARPSHYALFESLLLRSVAKSGARVLAYCWLPHSAHLCLETGRMSLSRLMQGLASRYARARHTETHTRGHLYAQRYRSVLVDPQEWLLPLIRYIHAQPILAGVVTALEQWPHSSHHIYAGARKAGWVYACGAQTLLEKLMPDGGYELLMSQAPSVQEIRVIERGGCVDARILGSEDFVRTLPTGRTIRPRESLEDVIVLIARALEVDAQQLSTRSGKHELSLARAVVAWYATERGVATLSAVAGRLRRAPSTLSMAIDRHRRRRPELFDLTAYRHQRPLI